MSFSSSTIRIFLAAAVMADSVELRINACQGDGPVTAVRRLQGPGTARRGIRLTARTGLTYRKGVYRIRTRKNMKIYLAKPRGFCAGVDRAIEIVDLSLKAYGAPIYVRHEI